MITDDMPISVGNLKALIPQIVARGGAFSQGYWRGEIQYPGFYASTSGSGRTLKPQSITGSGGRVNQSGIKLVFTDAGKYRITAEMSGENNPNDPNYQANGTISLNAVRASSTTEIDSFTGRLSKLDGETFSAEISVSQGESIEFDLMVKPTSSQVQYESFALINVNIIRIE